MLISKILFLGVAFSSSIALGGDHPICSLAAGGIPVAQPWSIPEISWQTITKLRLALSDIFINSDQVLKLYQSRNRRPVSVSKLGSGLSASSYGIYNANFANQKKDMIFKVPLRYPLETLFNYFGEYIPALPKTSDPMDFSDSSPRAVHQRRTAGLAILLQHFFRVLERETGVRVTPHLLLAYSRSEVRDLLGKFPEMSFPEDDSVRSTYQNLPPKGDTDTKALGPSISDPRDLIGFGMVFEKLNIVIEAKKNEGLFRNTPGVRSQVLVLAWLLSQLGIELPDASPVLTAEGRVNLIDLDEAIVAIRIQGQVVIVANVEPEKLEYFSQEYSAGRLQNISFLDKAGLTIRDLWQSSAIPRR